MAAKKKSARSRTTRTSNRKTATKKTAVRTRATATAKKAGETFPRSFLFGTATAATQIDGGDVNSDWYQWCETPGKIADKKTCFTACDHWQRYDEDFKLMKSMGHQAYRLGVDWSRFQPAPGAPFDILALEHFRKMLGSLRAKRIRPLLTLNHFVLPYWWLEKGGWTKAENLPEFYAFVNFIVEGVGDLVEEYITFNEPNVYAVLAYMDGRWPPGKRGISGYLNSLRVQRNMLIAHFHAYDRIREIHAAKNWKHPSISIAKHLRVMDPKDSTNALDLDRAREADRRFNHVFTDSLHSGCLLPPLGAEERVHDGQAWDFFGLNYYTRDIISFSLTKPGTLFIKIETHPENPRNDLQWEIYPEGLFRLLKQTHERYSLPIRITENGIADAVDARRSQFLMDHLRQVLRALEADIPVEGYYHWSFMDNFEWAEGYTARFGLVHVDFESQKRSPRESAKLYSKIIRSRKIPG